MVLAAVPGMVWVSLAVLVVGIGVIEFVRQQRHRRCPRCGMQVTIAQVENLVLTCPHCEFDFRSGGTAPD